MSSVDSSSIESPARTKPKREQSPLIKHYLALYNLIQFFGWGYGLFLTVGFFTSNKSLALFSLTDKSNRLLWERCSLVISIFQTYQLVEVLHAIIRFVPSNPFTTFVQILSRLVLVWGVLVPVPESRNSIGVPMLLVAWCIAECTRYIYYALNIYDAVPYVSTWLRYTLFIVLYPLGVSGELLTTYTALSFIKKSKLWSLYMPNALNVSFHYDTVLICFMLSYLHFFPNLYIYMLVQRRKIIGGQNDSKKTK